MNKSFPAFFKTLEWVVIFLAFVLVNVNSFIRFRQFSEVENFSSNELDYIFIGVITIMLVICLLLKRQLSPKYFEAWRKLRSP